jgi:long-chain fatty acid transport protein
MKKTLFVVLAIASLLFAESYQVNTLSAKQMGMAHTGAGIKLGSESMHFNPGGLGFLNKTLDISAGATFIMPEVEFWGRNGKTVNDKLGTPLYVYAASNITDWFSAGISFTTPYGNSADYGKDWEGAGLLQDISLAVYALQPTLAFKPMSELSIGAGPVVYFGSFEQSKAIIPPGGQPALQLPNTSAVSATFSGDADVAVAVNAGIMYDILPDKLALGVGYRSEAKMKVAKGKTEVNYLNDFVKSAVSAGIPTFEKGSFKAELPLPANLNTGISFRPMENLLLAFDWQWVFWGTYDKLAIDFTDDVTVTALVGGSPVTMPFNKTPNAVPSTKKYHDTFAYRLGAQYTLIDQLDVRLGVYFDESPVDDEYLTPESPSTNKLGSTIGLSFRPISGLSIDASLLRSISFPEGRDATSGSSPGKKNADGSYDGINGRYEVTAWVPSVGLNYNF